MARTLVAGPCSQADHHGFTIRGDPDHGRWRTHRPDGTEILIGPLTDTRGDPLPDLRTTDPPLFPRRA